MDLTLLFRGMLSGSNEDMPYGFIGITQLMDLMELVHKMCYIEVVIDLFAQFEDLLYISLGYFLIGGTRGRFSKKGFKAAIYKPVLEP
jgi:hypothetical protein